MKRVWLVLLVSALVITCLGLFIFQQPRPGVNHRNLQRIQNGMTETQVEEILGGTGSHFGANDLRAGARARIWLEKKNGRGGIIVYFDEQGEVYRAFAFPQDEVPP